MALSHINEDHQPQMVDITAKAVTERSAIACSRITFPVAVMQELINCNWELKKGAVFQTAILAGTMAVKKTADWIPLCHPLPLEGIDITLDIEAQHALRIKCTVKTTYKTGVEMEALVGASAAALTVYDMCKALSHEMVIEETKLLSKTGGKNDFKSL